MIIANHERLDHNSSYGHDSLSGYESYEVMTCK